MGLARERYPAFEEAPARAWAETSLSNPNLKAIRGEKSFALGAINSPFYAPSIRRGYCVFIAAEHGVRFEPCALLRHLISWAFTECGAQTFRFGSDTDCDMSALAKRVGATTESASYVVRR